LEVKQPAGSASARRFVWYNLCVKWLSDTYTWSAEASVKWLWAVTLANTVVLLAGAVFVSVLPRSILLPLGLLLPILGIALSVTGFVTGFRLTKAVVSRTSLRVAYVINGFALAFHLLIILGLSVLWLVSVGLLKLSDMH
jgi:hypothetical protein